MTDQTDQTACQTVTPMPIGRIVARLMGVALMLLAVVAPLAAVLEAAWVGAVAAWGVCLAAMLCGLAPMWAMSRMNPQTAVLAPLVALVVRLFVAAAGIAVLIMVVALPMPATVWWAMTWYLVLMGCEVALLYRQNVALRTPAINPTGQRAGA
ncbi:MAG: hypothetical protein IT445_03735 [Phycisphaeraceae bacterium]|nr:hypothetical protein [Phycisphaeraceae bacterium]